LIPARLGDKEPGMSSPAVPHEAPNRRRVVTQVESLNALVGAYPGALREIYLTGRATDPAELGDAPRGRLLALSPGAGVFLALRPLLRGLATDLLPWQGKVFDHGGNSGQNVVLGRRVLRFRAEEGPSEVDGRPALLLTYDAPAHGNPWPVRAVKDELRTVGDGIAIGPAFFAAPHGLVQLLWFGLTAL
jgi:hypothetical protein